MSEVETKAWYKSKTVVSGLLTAVIGILVTVGVLTPEAATPESVSDLSNNWIDIATSVGIVITGVIAVVGRFKATTKVGK